MPYSRNQLFWFNFTECTMFLKQEQDSVKFILEDEGPGIEDDVKSRIFDKFYQGSDAGSDRITGKVASLSSVSQ